MAGEFERWCGRVERQVRFFPDRKAIRRELTDHYWDHVQDLRRIGYEDGLARQRALGAMGDPEEVGKALNAVHRPLLGWLWMVSRVLAAVLLVLTLWCGWSGDFGGWHNVRKDLRRPAEITDCEAEGPAFLGPESPLWESGWQRTALLASSPEPWENGDYTVSVAYAAVWREERRDGNVYHWLSVRMRAEKRRFWDEDMSLVPLTVTDSAGRRYVTAHWKEDSPVCDVNWNNPEQGLTFLTYHLNVPLESAETDWVELGYILNEDFSIRLNFREVTP
ncbi:hypothetical protein [Dysosmobacter sp.]|uniref:hypothetical protein n=1 Tax=Dysosmobacter sp. TaxID=2591382 RepID=UPI002A895B51|nr:hypothetical protein [Dysosmobacter sp.]MDY3280932.1 hypothetical protein [Dysosmobacter sp.]